MLEIRFVLNGEDRTYQYDDSQRDIANAMVQTLRENRECTSLLCVKADGSCIQFKQESEKCFAVEVLFKGSDKKYTYGCKYFVKPDEEVIVSTWEGLKVVRVVSCTKIEKTALPTLTHGKKPQFIEGRFTRF